MSIYKQPSSADRIFNIGFWIGVGSLFYFPYVIFVGLGIIGLSILRAFRLNEVLMVLIGAFVPYFLAFCIYFWIDESAYFWQQQFHFQLKWGPLLFPASGESYVKIGMIVVTVLTVLFTYNRHTLKQNIQIQKKISLLFWAIVIAIFTPFLINGLYLDHLIVFTLPVGIILSFNFQIMPRRAAEALHILLLAVIFFLQYNSWFLAA